MMNKFETTVRRLIACLIVAMLPLAIQAETESDGEKSEIQTAESKSCTDANRQINGYYKEDGTFVEPRYTDPKAYPESLKNTLSKCDVNTNDSADCRNPKGKYLTALGELTSACRTLGGGNSNEDGWPACTKAMVQCTECMSNSEETAGRRSDLQCDSVSVEEEEEAPAETPDSAFGLLDLKTAQKRLNFCPGKLGAEEKDREKQKTESQKEVRRLESELPKKQAEYAALVAKGQEDMLASQEKMTSAQSEFDNQMLELQNSQDDAVKGITEQIRQADEQIRRVDDSIRQVELSKGDIENSYTEQLQQIQMNCHASASQTTSKLQQDRLQLERTNQFNRASFNAMMKTVGVSDHAQWERVADKYYKSCLRSKATKTAENSALKARDSALAKAQEAIAKLERDKESLRTQIAGMKSENGCAQNGQANDMCRAMQKFQRQAESYNRQYNTKMNQANSAMAAKQSSNAAEQQAKMAEATLIQQQLADERLRLKNYNQYLEYIYQAGGGMTADEAKSYNETQGKFGNFLAAAMVYTSCNTQTNCDNDLKCKEAAMFQDKNGIPPTYSDSTSDKAGDATVDGELPSTGTPAPDSGKPATKETEGVRESKEIYPGQLEP